MFCSPSRPALRTWQRDDLRHDRGVSDLPQLNLQGHPCPPEEAPGGVYGRPRGGLRQPRELEGDFYPSWIRVPRVYAALTWCYRLPPTGNSVMFYSPKRR